MENETYCGKSCEICTDREAMSCPGCRQGPGGTFAKCAIARCCRDKRHETCGTCTSWSYCGLRNGREQEPILRQKKQAQEERQQQEIRDKAPVLSRWINVLFWLFIPQIIAGLMTEENVVKNFPDLLIPGVVLTVACVVIYSAALWRMHEIHSGYRKAAICNLVYALGYLLALTPLQVMVNIVLAVVSLLATYLEYTTHSEVLAPTNMPLSLQWRQLWTWNIWCVVGLVVFFILLWLIPVLGLLGLLAVAIATIVLQILKLVYLRRMIWHFREFC